MRSHQSGTLKSYSTGFLLSLLLTAIPFWLVIEKVIKGNGLLLLLAVFAVLQILVQITYFLHLNSEPKPRWQSLAFKYMIVVVVIVVFGSIWIMNSLHYRMVTGHEVGEHVMEEEAIESYNGQR